MAEEPSCSAGAARLRGSRAEVVMTRRQAAKGFLGIAVTAIVAATATAQSLEPKARPLLVGVVDLGIVFTRYQRTMDLTREIDRERQSMAEKAREQRSALDALRKDLDATPEGTVAYQDKAAALKLAQKGLEAMDQEAVKIAEQRVETLTLQIFDEIEESVRDFAKKNKYDLIVKTTTKGWGKGSLPERTYRAQVSTVVAYDPKLDVTDPILAQLNDAESLKKKSFH
jgi:Skp family chaperone for outer membrane proteins